MFAFEVEEARLRRHADKKSDDVDDFMEWTRWKKGRSPVLGNTAQPAAQQQQQQQAVNLEPKGEGVLFFWIVVTERASQARSRLCRLRRAGPGSGWCRR